MHRNCCDKMSEHASPAFADLAAKNHSENDDRQMSQLGQTTELRNGKESRGWIPPCAAGPTEPNSNGKLLQCREPRSWISKKEWTNYVQDDPRSPHLRNRLSSVVSIFRVPKFLKDTKKEAYVPQRVSLGPHHHGSAELPAMGHHKGRALRKMKARSANRNLLDVDQSNMDFANRAMAEILKLENEIRDSYEERIDCDGETLARMLSLDGCFLLEVCRTLLEGETDQVAEGETDQVAEASDCYDPIFGESKLQFAACDIVNDILMLENQVPFIVLRKLLELEGHSAVVVDNMLLKMPMEITWQLFSQFDCKRIDIQQWPCHHHLLGCLHTVITSSPGSSQGESVDQGVITSSPGSSQGENVDRGDSCCSQCIMMIQCKSKAENEAESIPRAVELRNAGIKFSPLHGGIKDIKFDENSATIFLPPICITDITEIVLRNLIAFETCKPSKGNYVICYASLMNDLIDSEEDVALLRRMNVLKNWVGSDKEVADLFNALGKEVTVTKKEVFDKLTEKVNAHYNNVIKVQIGQLVQDHFSSPWKACAFTAAIVALLLTAVQTILAIIAT